MNIGRTLRAQDINMNYLHNIFVIDIVIVIVTFLLKVFAIFLSESLNILGYKSVLSLTFPS